MQKYKNKSGRSGVEEYELDPDGKSIKVTFKNGGQYSYSVDDGNDMYVMSQMHGYADNGEYLNRFINSHQPKYTRLSPGEPTGYRYRGTLKPEDEGIMSKIHSKYIFGKPSIKNQLKQAYEQKLKASSSFKHYQQLRKGKY